MSQDGVMAMFEYAEVARKNAEASAKKADVYAAQKWAREYAIRYNAYIKALSEYHACRA